MKDTTNIYLAWAMLLLASTLGCNTESQPTQPDSVSNAPTASDAATVSQESDQTAATADADSGNPDSEADDVLANAGPTAVYELRPDDLLAAELPEDELREGWVRLFDGQSLHGWFVVGQANWRVSDSRIVADRGEVSFLSTSFQLADYELKLDFRCTPSTNSGIFLRTQPQPGDVATECLELNIAPPDNPFPTGSFVGRKKLEPSELGDLDFNQWHTYRIKVQANTAEVYLDGQQIMQLDDFSANPIGHISLQHNSGQIEFREIKLRPLQLEDLATDADWMQDWVKSEKEEGTLQVTGDEQGMRIQGGLGQLQSKQSYDDFFLQASYTLAKPEVNSGIFFRCVPDSMLDGYECQVNHAILDNDPLRPADAGAGAIFRREAARIVIGDGTAKTYLSLVASGQQITTWVNGVPICDFRDTREPDENPRRGLRLEAGRIALQGHDPETDVTFHTIRVASIP